ncbi:MAG: hypothetical protein V4722_00870 [Bacteroidota bacterium]
MKKIFPLVILLLNFSMLKSQSTVTEPVGMWVNSNGAVGIGTPTPGGRLQINHVSGTGNPSLFILDSLLGTGNVFTIGREGVPDNIRFLAKPASNRTNAFMGFAIKDDSIFWLKGNGRLGLGTTNPGARLQINGTSSDANPTLMMLDSLAGNGNLIQFRRQGVSNFFSITTDMTDQNQNAGMNFGFYADATGAWPLLSIKGDGKLGVGTKTPVGRVQINHRSNGATPSLMLLDSSNIFASTVKFANIGVNGFSEVSGLGSELMLGRNGTGTMWLKANGAVGVGTSSPQARLQINHRSNGLMPSIMMLDSSNAFASSIRFVNMGVNGFSEVSGLGSEMVLSRNGQGTMWLKPNGAVGIGTPNPTGRMQINHSSGNGSPAIFVLDSLNGNGNILSVAKEGVANNLRIVAVPAPNSANSYIGFISQLDSVMWIRGNGRIGINNPNPANTLDIVGDVNVVGSLKMGNTGGLAGQVLASNGNNPSVWKYLDSSFGFNVYNSGYTLISSGQEVTLIAGSERFDDGDKYNPTVSTYFTSVQWPYEFTARVALNFDIPNDVSFNCRLVLELLSADGITVLRRAEQNQFVPSSYPSGTFTFSVNTRQKMLANQRVRVRFYHDRGFPVSARLEEFSGMASR